jgi:hypothetical protein
MKDLIKKVNGFVVEHPFLAIGASIVFGAILSIILIFSIFVLPNLFYMDSAGPIKSAQYVGPYPYEGGFFKHINPESKSFNEIKESELFVKEASFKIKSKNVEDDAKKIENEAIKLNGYVETKDIEDTQTYKKILMTVRVPYENFEQMINFLQSFDVLKSNVRNYRINIYLQLKERDIILQGIRDYNLIRQKILSKNSYSTDDLRLLSEILSSQRKLSRDLENSNYGLYKEQLKSQYPKISVEIYEEKPIQLIDKDFFKDIMLSIKNLINTVYEGLKSIIFGSLKVIIECIVWILHLAISTIFGILYLVFLAVCVYAGYRLFKKIVDMISKFI